MNILDSEDSSIQTVYINTSTSNQEVVTWSVRREGDDDNKLEFTTGIDDTDFETFQYYQSLNIDFSSIQLNRNQLYILKGTNNTGDTIYYGKMLAYYQDTETTLSTSSDYIIYE